MQSCVSFSLELDMENISSDAIDLQIGWHIAQGLAVQLVERVSSIEGTFDARANNETCDRWNAYAEAAGVVQFDSGI